MASDGYLNLKDAAKYLGVSDTKIRRLIGKGLMNVSFDPLDDRKRLVKKSDLDALKTPRPMEGTSATHQQKMPRRVVCEKRHSDADKENGSDEQ